MLKLRLALGAAGLLVAAALLSAAQRSAAAAPPDLRGFQAVTPAAGWVLLGDQLYWTDDAGAHWTEITPPALGAAALTAGWFADPAHGWLVALSAAPGADPRYQLLTTSNGGQQWQAAPLDLFAPGETAALAGEVFLNFSDARTGWLEVKQATGSAFDLRTTFRTADGGVTWTRQADGSALTPRPGAAELSMATATAGWSVAATGACAGTACALTVQLRQTTDGGASWQPLPLPGGRAALMQPFTIAAESSVAASTAAYTFTFTGHGFDGCFVDSGGAPLAGMQAWMNASPYRARNLYLGGSGAAPCTPLSKTYIQQLAQQGWVFIPTWVGPQAPCFVGSKRRMSGDPAVAYQQGIIEGHLALDRAAALGLTGPDGAGTVLYYDVESVPPGNPACGEAVEAFISGWTLTLRTAGSLSGVYGSPCSSYLPDLAGIAHVPDAVWLARWIYSGYNASASVWGVQCISDSLWSQGQRLRQYTGGHNEEWGGVTLNIDSNVLAGPAATVPGNCLPGAAQIAVFIFPNFGGQCALRNTGVYSTVVTLGLPNDTISSIRVGPGAKVRVCEHVDLGGLCTDLTASAAQLSAHPIGDNQVSSFAVETATLTLTPRLYLPLVGAAPHVVSLWPNGGFEAGPTTWGLASTNGRALIMTKNNLPLTGNTTHSGDWAAWLGGVISETAVLAQTLTVPTNAPYLAYWQWVDSNETGCYYDVVSVWVSDSVVDAYGLCASLETNSWTRRTVDLRAYAGQTVALRLQLVTDGSADSSVFLDDVAFESGP